MDKEAIPALVAEILIVAVLLYAFVQALLIGCTLLAIVSLLAAGLGVMLSMLIVKDASQ